MDFESTFNDYWTDHANRINDNEFSAYGDKAYLYIPNSNEEHVVWLSPKLQNQSSWYFIGIHKNYRYILPDHKTSKSPKLSQLKEVLSLITFQIIYDTILSH